MPDENKYRIAFLTVAAVVITCAFVFGKCSREDQSYKMAGVEPGDIVVNAHKYNPMTDPPRPPKQKSSKGGGASDGQ